MKAMTMEHPEQLELGLGGPTARRLSRPAERRLARAAFWFGQMHKAVNQAFDWRPAPPARPRQDWLPQLVTGRP